MYGQSESESLSHFQYQRCDARVSPNTGESKQLQVRQPDFDYAEIVSRLLFMRHHFNSGLNLLLLLIIFWQNTNQSIVFTCRMYQVNEIIFGQLKTIQTPVQTWQLALLFIGNQIQLRIVL